jgi:hypothetical protein
MGDVDTSPHFVVTDYYLLMLIPKELTSTYFIFIHYFLLLTNPRLKDF